MTDSQGRVPAAIQWARKLMRVVAVAGASMLALGAGTASAAYVHTNVTGEYGKEGPKAGGLGNGCRIAYQSANERLYLLSDNKIYGLQRSGPGSVSPIAGNFPLAVSRGDCGDPDFEIDNSPGSSKNNIYYVASGSTVSGWNSLGTALPSPWPVSPGSGETCGLSVDGSGNVFAGYYSSGGSVKEYTSGGELLTSFNVGVGLCKLDVDRTTGDVYVQPYSGGSSLRKYTAASGYSSYESFPAAGDGNAGLAVNGSQHRIYIANNSSTVKAYSTIDGSLLESINVGSNARGIAVDEATDTVFVAVGSGASGYIQERPGLVVPDLTTSEPTGFATLHGHIDPAGGGEVTSCEFEFSKFANYSSPSTVPCTPAPNYSGEQDVTADLTGLVTGEVLYHYRLRASNANGSNISTDATFTPHYVAGLHTDPADEIDRQSAKLHGSYLGTGEETTYYFKWGKTTAYGNTTPSEAIPGNNVQNEVSASLEDVLEPGTLYHYKIVASNGQGTSEGNDATFETKPAVFGLATEPATNIKTTTADLNGSFLGDGYDTTYFFEYGSSDLYGNSTEPGELTAPSGTTTIPAASISELKPLHTYHFRAVAENSFGRTHGPDETFTTFTAPIIVAQSTSGLTATEADLHAVINPHGVDAEYHFEYGKSSTYGTSVPIPDEVIPASETPQPVEVHLTGLDGGVYHFRVAATNVYGESKSRDETFNFYPPECPNGAVRQQTGSNDLPDCRAYELVTPEDQGITIIFPSSVPFSATATTPSRLVFAGSLGLIPDSGEPINNVDDTYVATRTNQGWKTRYVGLPSSKTAFAGGPPWNPPNFEPDMWVEGVLANPSLSALVDWNGGEFGNGELFAAPEHKGSSNAPYVWDTTSGKQIDRWPSNVGAVPDGEHFKGRTMASSDLSHFVFTSDRPFAIGGEAGDMYDNDTVHATVSIVSLTANDEHIANTRPLFSSADGSHVLMGVGTGEPPPYNGAGQLYMRVNAAMTYEIAPGSSVQYIGMTPDGRKVYFTTAESLLPEDEDTSRDLYMWSEEGAEAGLTLVSKGNEPNAGNTDICSASWTAKCGVVAISFKEYSEQQGGLGGRWDSGNFIAPENGDIYFLSPEQLAGNDGVNGQENMFVHRDGKLQFVASLDPSGIPCTENQYTVCAENAVARMETTRDDTYMSFLTASNVTGYDSQGHSEIYRYAPASDEMICVSCVPTGDPPTSDVYASHDGRFMTEDGRTFFDTRDALVPQDTNEAGDVYEYVDGRPQLITTGTNVGNEVFGLSTIGAQPGLIGVSADGTDVYFATYDVLVGQDRNGEAVKIYDARSSGGFQYVPPVPPCAAADECHGPSSEAPTAAPNGTGADLGASGNIQQLSKKKLKRRHRRHHRRAHRKRHKKRVRARAHRKRQNERGRARAHGKQGGRRNG